MAADLSDLLVISISKYYMHNSVAESLLLEMHAYTH